MTFNMSPSTSSQFQLNPNKKKEKKKRERKKRTKEKEKLKVLTYLGQRTTQVAGWLRNPFHTHGNWPYGQLKSRFHTWGSPTDPATVVSLSLSLLALFSLRCAQRWRLLYTTFVSPDFQFVCRNLSIWCFSPSDCWDFGLGFLFSPAKNWLLFAPESPLVTSSFWDDGGGSIAWLPHPEFFFVWLQLWNFLPGLQLSGFRK